MAANPLAEKRGPKIGDAASLWNFTPSPGWSKDEVQILKLLLMKHGVGRWVQILEDGLLPGKLIQQLNGQTQRLLGQQSLAAYTGLQVDVDRIRADNEAKADVERKGGLIINTGPNLTKPMKLKLQEEAQAKYGLTPEQIKEVEEQIEETRAALKQDTAGGSDAGEPGVRLLSTDPSTLSKQQKLALLKRLHAQLQAGHAQLQAAMQVGAAPREPQPAAAAKPADCRPTNSNAENEPAAANTDPMEVDPPADSSAPAAAAPATKPAAGKAGGAKRKAASGSAKKVRAAKPAEVDGDASDGDWRPKSGGVRGGKGRRKSQSQDVDMQDSGVAGVEESAADAVAAANVRTLQDMGFSAQQARQALEDNDQCLEMALEWLTTNCI